MKKIVIGAGSVALILVMVMALKSFVFLPDEFKAQPQRVSNCPSDVFDKSAVIFDALTICGTNGVSSEKLLHAANVAAQWLDNDEDGVADNLVVNNMLAGNKATVVMSSEGFGLAGQSIFAALEAEGRFGQDLHAVETNNPERRDASQEELHHIIIGAGWAAAYPDLFDDQSKTSAIYRAWSKADAEKYYQYGDPTCDDQCKVMEFVYKSTAAYLDAESDLADDEFTIRNREDLRQKLPSIVALYEAGQYSYPVHKWPDGNYPFKDEIAVYPKSGQ